MKTHRLKYRLFASMFVSFLAVVFTAPSAANAESQSPIDVVCQRGDSPWKVVKLSDCHSKLDRHGYGPYSCSGAIDEVYSVRAFGQGGSFHLNIEISYGPGKFTGYTPISVNGEGVGCMTLKEYESEYARR